MNRRKLSAAILVATVCSILIAPSSSASAPGVGSGRQGTLLAVSASSANDVWAVGYRKAPITHADETLILHSNGSRWRKVPSPNPGGTLSASSYNRLTGVSAIAADDAWAVGYYGSGGYPDGLTLILHWDGTSWTQVPSPNPSVSTNRLTGVSAIAADDAWAVGGYMDTPSWTGRTLTLHWNGTDWSQVSSPNPSSRGFIDDGLIGVSGGSPTDVWALGYGNGQPPLTFHWDGTSWTQVANPSPNGSHLLGVSTDTAGDALSVGGGSSGASTFALRSDGADWVETPTGFTGNLSGVSASSASDAWAVGWSYSSTLALHWDGTSWTQVASPNVDPLTSNSLRGVSTTSATNAWAVGDYNNKFTIVLHWDGTGWTEA